MTYFISCTRNGNTCYMRFDGMDQPTITNLLAGLGASNVGYITQEAYNTATAID